MNDAASMVVGDGTAALIAPRLDLILLMTIVGVVAVCVLTERRRPTRSRLPWPTAVPVCLLVIGMAISAGAQTTASYGFSRGSGSNLGVPVISSPILGSVPSGPAKDEVLQLTFRDAINLALRYNLGSIERGEDTRITRGQRLLAMSALLPQVRAGVTEGFERSSPALLRYFSELDLQNFPKIAKSIGPYSSSKTGASLSQTLFSLPSIERFRAARSVDQAAQLSYQDVLDVVTLVAGNAYLRVIEFSSRIEAAQAQVRNAQALYNQAADELQAGTAPRIDVTRTEVQLHIEQYNLSVARNDFAIAKLTLGRVIGLPRGQAFEIADQLPYAEIEPPSVEAALKTAYHSRSDLQAAIRVMKGAEQTLSAARGERYPVLAANGSYTELATTFAHLHPTFGVEAGVSIPVFTGGQIKGDITQAEAALRQRKAEAENIRGQIDYDVRTALLNLSAAREQVDVTRRNVDLANENLDRSRDRFTSGVTDSVEVVQAEQSLASANDQFITSVYDHNLAKLALARALGVAHTSYNQYLGGR
jgi:outer membrane protein TolC